jgi:hypothetical protein
LSAKRISARPAASRSPRRPFGSGQSVAPVKFGAGRFDDAPAQRAPIPAEPARCDQLGFVYGFAVVFQRRDIKCVDGAIALAKEAGFAIIEARNDRSVARPWVEYVARTGVDARVALYTTIAAYELDHAFQPPPHA